MPTIWSVFWRNSAPDGWPPETAPQPTVHARAGLQQPAGLADRHCVPTPVLAPHPALEATACSVRSSLTPTSAVVAGTPPELIGNRGIYHDGWFVLAFTGPPWEHVPTPSTRTR
jgi:hypothetical protein